MKNCKQERRKFLYRPILPFSLFSTRRLTRRSDKCRIIWRDCPGFVSCVGNSWACVVIVVSLEKMEKEGEKFLLFYYGVCLNE